MKKIIINLLKKKFGIYITTQFPREAIIFISKNMYGKSLTGAEIGIDNGYNAKSILKTLNIRKLYLVDIEIKKELNTTLKGYNDKIEIINTTSKDAAKEMPNNLDFAYIDADHSYSHVKEDIEIYYSVLKKKGVLSGHDINLPSVAKAVSEFALKKKLELNINNKDWWIVKKC